ncbi:MAG: hypothetical protein K2P81_01180 [Bacteriovoracaceae bacterium]|nr:hypothetical protein [Bacteriovoracaceae bacterium]
MKTLFSVLTILLVAQGCDAPQRVRTSGTTFDSNLGTSGQDSSGTNFGTAGSTGGTTTSGTTTGSTSGGTTTGGTTTGGQTINCIKTATAYHAGLGNVDVCQDSANEVYFKLTYSTTDQNDGTCIVPMYKDGSGNSTYLGSAQCTKHNQGQVVYGNVSKNRNGYSGYQINSVMVLKYSGTNAFFQCMNAYGTYFQSCMAQYNNNQFYQSYCNTQATNYMTNLCNTFKNNYPYSQVSTR